MLKTITFVQAALLLAFVAMSVSGGWTPWHLRNFNCSLAADKYHEIGCWGRLDCDGSNAIFKLCYPKTVFDRATQECVTPGEGNTDCSKTVSCAGKKDGNYPDIGDDCQTFYSCYKGVFKGRQYCAENLRFNKGLKVCDFKANVKCE